MRAGLPETAAGIGLCYFEPAPDLRSLISSYYFFWSDVPHFSDVMRADIGQLRFMLAGRGHYVLGETRVETPEICLLGPTTMATRFDVAGPVAVFGVGLHPAGWAALIRDDASLHADSASDAALRFGGRLVEMLVAMRDTGSTGSTGSTADTDAMVGGADAMFRVIAAQGQTPPLAFTRITDAWLTEAVDPSVEALVARLGISARQVERLTKRIYGAPPKLLARKYRSLRAASLIGTSELHWSDAVGDAFFDQSHFIRDFKQFTGLTPTQFQNDPPPITRLTLQRRAIPGNIAPLARLS